MLKNCKKCTSYNDCLLLEKTLAIKSLNNKSNDNQNDQIIKEKDINHEIHIKENVITSINISKVLLLDCWLKIENIDRNQFSELLKKLNPIDSYKEYNMINKSKIVINLYKINLYTYLVIVESRWGIESELVYHSKDMAYDDFLLMKQSY